MSLAKYHSKRHFDKTPEPKGSLDSTQGDLHFVVQKHAASRLHYDLRLELDGVLKSWAVPKGPSLDPSDKRLAVMVEDHPLDYRTFEGIIPKGNYGAGTVMVWDQGFYRPYYPGDREAEAEQIRKGLEKGHLSFVLGGEKLKGGFSLVKVKRGNENAWLLIKKQDRWASDVPVTDMDRSVASDRTLDEIAGSASTDPPQNKSKGKSASTKISDPSLSAAPKSSMPRNVKPMLAKFVAKPFDRSGWIFEVKWDGYRAIAGIDRKGVELYSRNDISFVTRYAPIVKALRQLNHDAVLDGEVVVVDDKGQAQFQLLQNYQKTGKGQLRYYVFDLLYLDGKDLCGLPLRKRKQLLARIVGGLPGVFLSEHVEEHGIAFFKAAAAHKLEGIIAKDGDSRYRQGKRGDQWLKIKTQQRQEAVVCGFTEPKHSRQHLGALVLGVYEGKELVYIGHTGTGFSDSTLADLGARLNRLVQRSCPFAERPRTNGPVHWVKPQLVCEVTFQDWTDDGSMRHSVFVGLREDKPATEVHRELATPILPAPEKPTMASKNGPPATNQTTTQSSIQAPRGTQAGTPIFTNLNKIYWPEEGYTKGDLIAYYRSVASVILPYLHDRPQSMNRHPNGIKGKSFFQKDVSRQPPPPFVETVTVVSGSDAGEITYILCQNEATLLYLANLGCIELNPWSSRVGKFDFPDYLIIDLDPVDVEFDQVVEAAKEVRKLLDDVGAASYCKTSGKRGLHVFVPLGAKYDYDQTKHFAEIVANLVRRILPDSTSVVRSPALRRGRVYLDFLQNRKGQTLAAAYSVRPFAGATVSTPLKWQEVKKGLDPSQYTIKTMPSRLDRVGDLWEPTLSDGVDLPSCLQRLQAKNHKT